MSEHGQRAAAPALRIDVITIFPDYLAPLHQSLLGRAIGRGLVDLRVHDLRDWTHDRHRTVDDTPYGGGAGMVMKVQPWAEALAAVAPPGGPQPRLVKLLNPVELSRRWRLSPNTLARWRWLRHNVHWVRIILT